MTAATDSAARDHLRCAVAAALLALALRLLVPASICDDAYITMTMARNLAEGHGLSFNAGERLYVSTAPLWALLIALVRGFGIDTIAATRMLGALAEMLLAVGMVHLGRATAGSARIGLVAAGLLLTNPALLQTSFSGMELPLYLAAIAWSLGLAVERRFAAALAIAAAAIWVRVDGVLVYLLVAGMHLAARRRQPGAALADLAPSLAIVAGYLCFGGLYFGELVPLSVQRKLDNLALFDRDWALGVGQLAVNFARALVGTSYRWYGQLSLLILAPLFLAAGLIASVRERRSTMRAPLAFALLYMVVFIGGGRSYALNFPWYFMPPLIALSLVAAFGIARIAHRIAPAGEPRLLTGFAALWAVAMAVTCFSAARALEQGVIRERERVYCAATVWLSRHLPRDGRIAANEIGTVGFFKRGDLDGLDLFGLLRTRDDRGLGAVELVAKYRPEAVITRESFFYRGAIDAAQPNAYVWVSLRSLRIGLRADLAPRLSEFRGELDALDRSVDLDREISDPRPARTPERAVRDRR